MKKFIDTKIPTQKIKDIFSSLERQKESIVLVGMPGSGKTTIGKELARQLCRVVDTDDLIREKYGDISEIFRQKGEDYFRGIESEVIAETAKKCGLVIATGGGRC